MKKPQLYFFGTVLLSLLFSLSAFSQTSNIECIKGDLLECSGTVDFNSTLIEAAFLNPCLGSEAKSLWYNFTGDDRIVTFRLESATMAYFYITVSTSSCEEQFCESIFYFDSNQNFAKFTTTKDVSYQIAFSTFAEGQSTIRVDCELPAANDKCEGAQEISCGDSFKYDNSLSILEVDNECFNTATYGLWYEFEGDGQIWKFSPSQSLNGSTILSFFEGDCADLNCTVVNSFSGQPESYTLYAKQGVSYKLLLSSYQLQIVDIQIDCSEAATNDFATGALSIDCGSTFDYNSTLATADYDVLCYGTVDNGLWYSITGNGEIMELSMVEANSNIYSIRIGVFTNDENGNLICLSSGDIELLRFPKFSFLGESGLDYKILISTYLPGSVQINLNCREPLTNDFCSNSMALTCDSSFFFDNSLATNDYNNSCFGYVPGGLWYSILGDGNIWRLQNMSGSISQISIGIMSSSCDELRCNQTSAFNIYGSDAFDLVTIEGLEYKILLFSYEIGNAEINVSCKPRAENDDCSNPTVLICGQTYNYNNESAFEDVVPCAGTLPNGLWYSFTGDGSVWTINQSSPNSNSFFAYIFAGDCSNSNCDGIGEVIGSNNSLISILSEVDKEYKVIIYTYQKDSFDFDIICSPPLSNDQCDTPQVLNCGESFSYENERATRDYSPCFGQVRHGLWYEFVGDGQIWVLTPSQITNINNYNIHSFSGDCATLNCLEVDAFSLSIQPYSLLTEIGVVYKLLITSEESGSIQFDIDCLEPAVNDLCQGAIIIECGNTLKYDNINAADDYDPCNGINYNSLWYTIDGNDQIWSIEWKDATIFSASIGIFKGECETLECVNVLYADSVSQRRFKFFATQGEKYFLNIGTREKGKIDFAMDCKEPEENDICSGANAIECGQNILYSPSSYTTQDYSNDAYYTLVGDGNIFSMRLIDKQTNVDMGGFLSYKVGEGQCEVDGITCITSGYFASYQEGLIKFATIPGTLYYLSLSSGYIQFDYELAIDCIEPAVNISCETANEITCGNTFLYQPGSTTDHVQNTCYGGVVNAQYYSLNGTGQRINIALKDPLVNGVQYYVLAGECSNQQCLTSGFLNSSGVRSFTFDTENGGQYQIIIHGSSQNSAFETTCIDLAINDICTGATEVSCGSQVPYQNLSASLDVSECYNPLPYGLWYTLEGTGDTYTIISDLSEASYFQIEKFNGSCDALICKGVNYTFLGGDSPKDNFRLATELGVTYNIVISNDSYVPLSTMLTFDCIEPAENDLCSSSLPITCGQAFQYSTSFALLDQTDCFNAPYGLWYDFVGDGSIVTIALNSNSISYLSASLFPENCQNQCIYTNGIRTSENSPFQFLTMEGVNYKLLVSSYNQILGDAEVTMTCAQPAINDICFGAIEIFCDAEFVYDQGLATYDIINGDLFSNGLWYDFVGTGEVVNIQIIEGNPEILLALIDDDCIDTRLTNFIYYLGEQGSYQFKSEEGKNYKIFIASSSTFASGPSTLRIRCEPQAPNDFCQNAEEISCSTGLFSYDSFQATFDNIPFGGLDKSLWYKLEGAGDIYTLSMDPNSQLPYINIELYEGDCDENIFISSAGLVSTYMNSLIFNAELNKTYYIVLGNPSFTGGTAQINIDCEPSSVNDNCNGAEDIVCGTTFNYSKAGAATDRTNCQNYIGEGKWYKLIPDNDIISIKLLTENSDVFIQLHSGQCENLICEQFIYLNANNTSPARYRVQPNKELYVLIGSSITDEVEILIDCEPAQGNDICSQANAIACGDNIVMDFSNSFPETRSELCSNIFSDVKGIWYSFNGEQTITTFNIGTENNVPIYMTYFVGTECSQLSCIDNVLLSGGNPNSYSLSTNLGDTYYVLVQDVYNSSQPISFSITCEDAKANDLCIAALPLNIDSIITVDMLGVSVDESPCGAKIAGTWYSYIGSGEVLFFELLDTILNEDVINIQLYQGDCDNLICYGTTAANRYISLPSLTLSPGVQYHILLSGNFQDINTSYDLKLRSLPLAYTDGCRCNNDASEGVKGSFTERFVIPNTRVTDLWTVYSVTDFNGSNELGSTHNYGDTLTFDSATSSHYLEITHLDNLGFNAFVFGPNGFDGPGPVGLGRGNICSYPNITVPAVIDVIGCQSSDQEIILSDLLSVQDGTTGKLTTLYNDIEISTVSEINPISSDSQIKWIFDADAIAPYGDYQLPGQPGCSVNAYSAVTQDEVSAPSLPNGTIAGSKEVCKGDIESEIIFTGDQGMAPYTFTYSVNNAPDTMVTTLLGNSIAILQSSTNEGIYVYILKKITDANGCHQILSETAVISVRSPIENLSISGPNKVCQDISNLNYEISSPQPFTEYNWNLMDGEDVGISSIGSQASLDFGKEATDVILEVTAVGICGTASSFLSIEIGSPAFCQLASCLRQDMYIDNELLGLSEAIGIYKAALRVSSSARIESPIVFRAGQSIEMFPQFEVIKGALFIAEIESCNDD